MSAARKVPDAWDDDWVENADSAPAVPETAPTNKKLSKAERRAKQAEFNRQLWDAAEAPEGSYYIHTRDDVPLKTEFKPAMKVLSRKPPSKSTSNDIVSGIGRPDLEDDDEDDEVDGKKATMTVEERQAKAQRDREEKQRKYEEVRQRLFGNDSSTGQRPSGNGSTGSPKDSGSRRQSRNRGGAADGRPLSSAGNKSRQLYDPDYTVKAGSTYIQKKEGQVASGRSTPSEQVPIRSPKGPDGSGRGGFGFVPRGGRLTKDMP